MLTKNLNADQITDFAKDRPELPWQWNDRCNKKEFEAYAKENNLVLAWGEPVKPNDLYLAKRNQGIKFLSCMGLGEACVHPYENAYSYDFSECVKIKL